MIEPEVRLFIRIVEAGSLAEAARRSGLSAPMASRQLARLEQRLGLTLLHRTTRRLELTSGGAIFYEDARRVLQAADAAQARIQGLVQTPSGPLRITAPTSFGRMHIAPILEDFRTAHPSVALTLDLGDGYSDLAAERYDLAVRITDRVDAGLHAEWLADSRRVLCAAPAFVARHGAPSSLAALANFSLLAASTQLPWRLTAGKREVVVEGRSAVQTNSSEVVRELALAGAGIALRSLWDVGHELVAGRLVRILPAAEGSRRVGIFAVRPGAVLPPAAVAAFVDHLRRHFSPNPPWGLASP